MSEGGDRPQGMLVCGRFAELEDALAERVLELKRDRPLGRVTVVVGSAAQRTRVNDLLVRRLGAIANVAVVTLARLAGDLVTETRGAPPAALAGVARERLVRRLVESHAGTLRYFVPVRDRPHFGHALAATFDDLREACVAPGPGLVEAVASSPGGSAGGRSKAADVERLYRAYCAECDARSVLDRAGVHLAAADVATGAAGSARAPVAGLGRLILYGIYDLNQSQESLVAGLLKADADMFVPVPRGWSRQGATALDVAAAAGGGERRLAAPLAQRDLDRVAAVWGAQTAQARDVLALSGDGTVGVVSVCDERAEAREAARSVMAAAARGAPLWECAVVVPHGDGIATTAAALRSVGLPVACRLPDRSLGPRLLVRLLDCLAPPAGEPFARRAVVDLLAAAPLRKSDASAAEMALWLDEARQAGVICGLEQWTERMGRRRRGLERRVAELEARRPEPADEEEEETVTLVHLRMRAALRLEAAAGALARACGGLPAAASWDAWAERLAGVAATLFEREAAEAVGDAAGCLRGLAVLDEKVDLQVVAGVLRDLLAERTVPVGRVGRDGVAVLTPTDLRGLSFHTVVFTGLSEGGFPSRGRPDPILGDGERRGIAQAMGVRLPLAGEHETESLLLFALACESARESLVLLSPRTDAATGRPRLPSRLLLRLASLAAGRPVGLDEFLDGVGLGPVWRRVAGPPMSSDGAGARAGDVLWIDRCERDTAVLVALSERGRRSAARGYLADVLGDPVAVERRVGAWRAARSPEAGPWDGLLGAAARAALSARSPFAAEVHPTRLERYIACPFAFLLRDVLGLDTPEEPDDALEMNPLEFGTLAHAILQRTYERVIADELTLESATTALAEAWTACCAEAQRRGVTGAALSWEVRRDMLLDDLLESVRRDPVFARSDGRPIAVEWRFGEAADRPVALDLPDGRMVRFAGRVDRVDAVSWGARVIDYKTGAGKTEKQRIGDGLSVQLPVYQLAVRQAGGVQYDSIVSLYRPVTRRGRFEDLPLKDDEAATGMRLRELVGDAVALVEAGMFPRTTRGRCDYCDLGYACGVSAWTRARKREGEALAPVVRLQGPAASEGCDDV